jgi:hypothetical protein
LPASHGNRDFLIVDRAANGARIFACSSPDNSSPAKSKRLPNTCARRSTKAEQKEDGEWRPRKESWVGVASHLKRLVLPKLGKMIAVDVTRDDIAELSNDILAGKYGEKSRSNARHMRRAVSGLYTWASEAGRSYVPETCRPCFNLPELPKEYAQAGAGRADWP